MIKGKLKKTVKNKCPYCNRQLQIRAIEEQGIKGGIEFTYKKEYIICTNDECDYEEELEEKVSKKRKYKKEE